MVSTQKVVGSVWTVGRWSVVTCRRNLQPRLGWTQAALSAGEMVIEKGWIDRFLDSPNIESYHKFIRCFIYMFES